MIHLLHVGKTGGTALKHALAPHAEALGLALHDHDVRLADLPLGDRAVVVLRDPAARFVSAFGSRRRQGRPRHDWPWTEAERRAFARFDTPNALAEALAADAPEARDAMAAIAHVNRPQTWWIGPADAFPEVRHRLLLVGRCERLDRDAARLSRLLGLARPLRLPADDVAAHRNPPGADRHLSPTARDVLRRWYAADHALLDVAAPL